MHFVIIFGPPAVGKMSVGIELSKLTGLPLFHNHISIEAVLPFFDYGHPAFARLVTEFRMRLFQEVAASELPGIISTYVWALDDANDKAFIDGLVAIFAARRAKICFVELAANIEERLRRNSGESRLAAKPSKRQLDASFENLRRAEIQYRMNSAGDFFYPHIKIDNSNMPPAEVAKQIIKAYSLPVRRPD